MNHKKMLWIAVGILLTLIVCGLITWLGSGMMGMIRNHLGL